MAARGPGGAGRPGAGETGVGGTTVAPAARARDRAGALGRAGALTIAALLATVVLAAAACTLFRANTSSVTMLGTVIWASAAPRLVLAALLATALAAPLARPPGRRVARAVAALALLALGAAALITARIVLAIVAAGGAINPLQALTGTAGQPAPDATETYLAAEGTPLRALIYRPPGGDRAPVLLYIHGGGWSGGAAGDRAADFRWYADRGWVVVSVEYRLATATAPTWDRAPADVGCALAWVAAAAPRGGGDPARLAIMGDSAGGNLALHVGWAAAGGRAPSSCPALGPVPVPRAVLAGYPVANPRDTYLHGQPGYGQHPRDLIETYIGGPAAAFPDRLDAISPATYIAGNAPPTLIIQPERDDFIPAAGAYAVAAQARAAGMAVTLARIPLTYHGFDSLPGSLGNQGRRTIVAHYLAGLGLAP